MGEACHGMVGDSSFDLADLADPVGKTFIKTTL